MVTLADITAFRWNEKFHQSSSWRNVDEGARRAALRIVLEVSMNWNARIRQIHRWVSIIFVAVVMGIFIALGVGEKPPNWVYLSPLLPLALLAPAGLYMFVRSAVRCEVAR
jgi:hypothetical protein